MSRPDTDAFGASVIIDAHTGETAHQLTMVHYRNGSTNSAMCACGWMEKGTHRRPAVAARRYERHVRIVAANALHSGKSIGYVDGAA